MEEPGHPRIEQASCWGLRGHPQIVCDVAEGWGKRKQFLVCSRGRASFLPYWKFLLKHERKEKAEKATVLFMGPSDSRVLNKIKLFFFLPGKHDHYQQLHMVQLNAFCPVFGGGEKPPHWVLSEDSQHVWQSQVPWCRAWGFNSFALPHPISRAQSTLLSGMKMFKSILKGGFFVIYFFSNLYITVF